MEDLRYWYGSALGNSGSGPGLSIPSQAIPFSKKNDKWKKANLDAFEAAGRKQLVDNAKFGDIFRMINGKMAYSELSEVMPQYRELEKALNDVELDTWIRHYDIIGVIINALAGELSTNSDKFSISTIDDTSTNEFYRVKTDKMWDYINVQLEKELKMRLLSTGVNPDLPQESFSSEEEAQAYQQQVEGMKAEMTPPQIQKYMTSSWKTVAAKWAELKLEEDTINHDMHDMDTENFLQFLATGRCFRHVHVAFDYYKPEVWHVLNTFFSQDLENKHVQHGDYVGRIHKYTRSQIINRFGHKLTPTQQKKILKTEGDYMMNGTYEDNFFGEGANVSYKKMFESHFHSLQTVAFENEPEYKMALDIQDSIGIPMGERMMLNRDGEYEKVPVLLPEINDVTGNLGIGNGSDNIFPHMRNEITLRTDLITVTEVYWRSYKRVGYLKYTTPEGDVASTIVSEELLPEFLKFNEIKTVSSIPLDRIDEDQEVNTIIWVLQPEVWQGTKMTDGDESYYVDIKPCEMQIKGDGNIYDVLLPVAGIVDHALAQKIEPYQVMYNVVMNQIFNLLEKEIGLFFIFDVNFLPSEFKDWGDTEDTLMYMRDIAKDIGILPVDSSKQNLVGGANFNQFSAQNLSFSTQISDRTNLAEFIKNKAFEQIGITPQRMGAPSKYETNDGIKVSQDASYAQTEQYFAKFSTFKKKYLEIHINVAQFCQKDGTDLQLFFTQSDAGQAFIKDTDKDFNFRRFSIVPISNSKKREELKTFKNWLMQTNTLGTDELAMAELVTSDSMGSIIEAARGARLSRQEIDSAAQKQQGEQLMAVEQARQASEVDMWEKEEFSKEKDRQKDIKVATINALGRAVDTESDKTGLDIIERQSKMSLEESKFEADKNNKNVELDIKKQQVEESRAKRLDDIKIKIAELATRKSISEDNKYIAKINKN